MPKISKVVTSVTAILFLISCADNTQISFFCEKDKKDNYIIKWEIYPEYKSEHGKIEVFASDNDSVFPKAPVLTTPANEFITVVAPSENVFREFFRLKLHKSYSGIISNRFFQGKNVQNFRDLGGYLTKDNKQIRWGKIYRSGTFSNPASEDTRLLKELKIKTVVDLRKKKQATQMPDQLPEDINYINIPIEVNYFNTEIKDKMLNGQFLKGDALIYTQDCYKYIIEEHPEEYTRLFDILLEEENYPVLIHCDWGKDRSGLAAYFILNALNIPSATIEADFLYSNRGINKNKLFENAVDMPESVQEAITMISKADISQLRYVTTCIKKKSGSVEEYMNKELKLDHNKIERLKEILLY